MREAYSSEILGVFQMKRSFIFQLLSFHFGLSMPLKGGVEPVIIYTYFKITTADRLALVGITGRLYLWLCYVLGFILTIVTNLTHKGITHNCARQNAVPEIAVIQILEYILIF